MQALKDMAVLQPQGIIWGDTGNERRELCALARHSHG